LKINIIAQQKTKVAEFKEHLYGNNYPEITKLKQDVIAFSEKFPLL